MGNRATVIFTDGKTEHSPAIYLHWNGGPESVYAFLAELDRRQIRADQMYEAARFAQIVGEFFDQDQMTGLSLGITNGPSEITPEALALVRTDPGDNGFYIVNRLDKPMRVRRFSKRCVQEQPEYRFELQEWSPLEVASEAKTARAHKYADIRRWFAERTKGKAIQGG